MSDNRAARGHPRVALITCAALPELDPDDRLLRGALAERGIRAEPAVWDAADLDWAGYRLAVLRSPWDYPPRHDDAITLRVGADRPPDAAPGDAGSGINPRSRP